LQIPFLPINIMPTKNMYSQDKITLLNNIKQNLKKTNGFCFIT